MTDRDTHFLGFAEALYEELAQNVVHTELRRFAELEAFKHEQHTIIARRAYDLAYHVLDHVPLAIAYEDATLVSERLHILVSFTPDLTSWPAPQSEPPTA